MGAIFLSTPSGWRATAEQLKTVAEKFEISIHALRVEGDLSTNFIILVFSRDFYPRPPGGGRLEGGTDALLAQAFLSTPSGWRATVVATGQTTVVAFLSTPSGWRATANRRLRRSHPARFLSTPSGWRATM